MALSAPRGVEAERIAMAAELARLELDLRRLRAVVLWVAHEADDIDEARRVCRRIVQGATDEDE